MTDPVREEMEKEIDAGRFWDVASDKIVVNLLRVMRRHIIWDDVAIDRGGKETGNRMVLLSKDMWETLESLPEEVKKSGKSEPR